MSEIRYIPPITAPTPGTTINPTNLFVPYRSNATTFLDSCLKQTSAAQLQTIFSGQINGINLASASNQYQFGLITAGLNCFLLVNGTSRIINLQDVGSANGLNVNFSANLYQFGKLQGTPTFLQITAGQLNTFYNGLSNGLFINFTAKLFQFGQLSGSTTTQLLVDDTGQQISGQHTGFAKGMLLNYNSRVYYLGEITTNNRTQLFVGDNLQRIDTRNNGNANGFVFEYSTRLYQFGQINGSNTNNLKIDDTNNTIFTTRGGFKTGLAIDTNISAIGSLTIGNQLSLGTDDSASSFIFNGTGITSPTSGGNAGHIKVLINGTPYKIAYQNP